MSAIGRKRTVNLMFFIQFERPLSGKADICDLFASPMTVGSFAGIIRDPQLPYSMMLTS